MFPRLPLPAKILLWFFLNLALLAGLIALFVSVQFRLDSNWVFATSARDRVDAMRALVADELDTTPPDEWEQVLDRFEDAYHVRFSLFDEDGNRLIGAPEDLPAEVRAKMTPHPHPALSPSAQHARHWGGTPPRSFLRTANPTRYWLLAGLWLDNPQAGGAMRVNLLAEDSSARMGGLLVDVDRWLEIGAAAIFLSVLFWWPLLRGMTRAIRQMTHATREIAEGRFDARVTTRRHDELGSLANAINGMAARLDGLINGQRRFLGDVAHELCAPLAKLQIALGIIEQRGDEKQQTYARSASEKAAQIAELVNQLLAFSRASFGAAAVHITPVSLAEAAAQAIYRESAPEADMRLDVPEDLAAAADAELLIRALANLLRNALRYGPPGGAISVHGAGTGTEVTISVGDNGPGVPEPELEKIFDPFYRVDAARTRETGGIGLGLTIVKTCVESCGGSVSARNRAPHGLEVTIHLPRAVAKIEPRREPARAAAMVELLEPRRSI
jgi:two-component system sensor histidine kinase CpxA